MNDIMSFISKQRGTRYKVYTPCAKMTKRSTQVQKKPSSKNNKNWFLLWKQELNNKVSVFSFPNILWINDLNLFLIRLVGCAFVQVEWLSSVLTRKKRSAWPQNESDCLNVPLMHQKKSFFSLKNTFWILSVEPRVDCCLSKWPKAFILQILSNQIWEESSTQLGVMIQWVLFKCVLTQLCAWYSLRVTALFVRTHADGFFKQPVRVNYQGLAVQRKFIQSKALIQTWTQTSEVLLKTSEKTFWGVMRNKTYALLLVLWTIQMFHTSLH